LWRVRFVTSACIGYGSGPIAESVGPLDRWNLGIAHLGGNVAELLRDAVLPLDSVCWAQARVLKPMCASPATMAQAIRGGDWERSEFYVYAGLHDANGVPLGYYEPAVGVRCVREDSP